MDSLTLSHTDQRRPLNAAEFLKYIRIQNIVLTIFFVFLIPLYITTLSVVVAKNQEVVDKFIKDKSSSDDDYYDYDEDYDDNNKELCIFGIDKDHLDFGDIKDCRFIINGSGVMAGCTLIMIIFLVIRTVVRQCNHHMLMSTCFAILDLIAVTVIGFVTVMIAVYASIGQTKTCDTLTDAYEVEGIEKKCSEVYIYSYPDYGRAVKLYNAMITAVVTSWIATAIIIIMAVIAVIAVILSLVNFKRYRRGEGPYNRLQDAHITTDN